MPVPADGLRLTFPAASACRSAVPVPAKSEITRLLKFIEPVELVIAGFAPLTMLKVMLVFRSGVFIIAGVFVGGGAITTWLLTLPAAVQLALPVAVMPVAK